MYHDETPNPTDDDRDLADPATEIFNLCFPPFPGGGCPECGRRDIAASIGLGEEAQHRETWAGCIIHGVRWKVDTTQPAASLIAAQVDDDDFTVIAEGKRWMQIEPFREVVPLKPMPFR